MELTNGKLNCAQAAAFIGRLAGRPITERTVRSWILRGILPYTRCGPRLVILDADELRAWYESGRGGPELPTLYASSEPRMS